MEFIANSIVGILMLPVISFGVCALVLQVLTEMSNWE